MKFVFALKLELWYAANVVSQMFKQKVIMMPTNFNDD